MFRQEFDERYTFARHKCGIMQEQEELWRVYERVAILGPLNILEIGTYRGGWVYVIAGASAREARFVGVGHGESEQTDRVRWRVVRAFEATPRTYHWIRGDSHKPETRKRIRHLLARLQRTDQIEIDLLHIDGDHSYEGCRADFEDYAPLVRPGGLVVFHDTMSRTRRGVHRYWEELKRGLLKGNWCDWCEEYYAPNGTRGVGTGILRRA